MNGVEVRLPGGLLKNGKLHRLAKFQPLTGRVEQQLIDYGNVINRPEYVTIVLSSVLDSIGDQKADEKGVADLCVADRQYLMLRLAAQLDGEQMWLKVGCSHCDAMFDIEVNRCDLPVKEGGHEFPFVKFRLKGWKIDARFPTGSDQLHLSGIYKDEEAMNFLLHSCISSVNGKKPGDDFFNMLSDSDINVIDNTLDEAAPAVCNRLLVTCPECGREQYARLDHYKLDYLNKYFFYDEIHTLASHYHWSESEILNLPKSKRRLYIDLINRSSGYSVKR